MGLNAVVDMIVGEGFARGGSARAASPRVLV